MYILLNIIVYINARLQQYVLGEDRQGGINFDIIIIERVHLFCSIYINILIMYMNM